MPKIALGFFRSSIIRPWHPLPTSMACCPSTVPLLRSTAGLSVSGLSSPPFRCISAHSHLSILSSPPFPQYGYHISVLNQIQGVLTCKVSPVPTSSDVLNPCIPMSDFTFSLVTSIFTIGGLAGSLVANLVMDRWGRKGTNRICTVFVAVGTALMGFSNSVSILLLGRYATLQVALPYPAPTLFD